MSDLDDEVLLDNVLLPARARHALARANCITVGDARRISDDDLHQIRGCGRTSIRQLRNVIGTKATRSDADKALRDHFAGLAMAATITRDDFDATVEENARWAYSQADAMLKARNQ
jgi:hypothetical protein